MGGLGGIAWVLGWITGRQPDTRFSGYAVNLPNGQTAACNPQRAPQRCAGIPIEP